MSTSEYGAIFGSQEEAWPPKRVEVRYSAWAHLLAAGGLLAVFFVTTREYLLWGIVGAIGIAIVAVSYLTLRLVADEKGVHYRSVSGPRDYPWDQIKTIDSVPYMNGRRLKLELANGRVIRPMVAISSTRGPGLSQVDVVNLVVKLTAMRAKAHGELSPAYSQALRDLLAT